MSADGWTDRGGRGRWCRWGGRAWHRRGVMQGDVTGGQAGRQAGGHQRNEAATGSAPHPLRWRCQTRGSAWRRRPAASPCGSTRSPRTQSGGRAASRSAGGGSGGTTPAGKGGRVWTAHKRQQAGRREQLAAALRCAWAGLAGLTGCPRRTPRKLHAPQAPRPASRTPRLPTAQAIPVSHPSQARSPTQAGLPAPT